jgi:hypothetical protein
MKKVYGGKLERKGRPGFVYQDDIKMDRESDMRM